jgi:prophage regulatory protein
MMTTHNGADGGPVPPEELLWNIKTVIAKTGLSRPSIYRYMKRGRFPPRRRVGPNRVAWVPAEVIAWIERCPRLGQYHGTPKEDHSTEHHQPPARMCAQAKTASGCIDAPPTQDANP